MGSLAMASQGWIGGWILCPLSAATASLFSGHSCNRHLYPAIASVDAPGEAVKILSVMGLPCAQQQLWGQRRSQLTENAPAAVL